jgi:hypothetical protein
LALLWLLRDIPDDVPVEEQATDALAPVAYKKEYYSRMAVRDHTYLDVWTQAPHRQYMDEETTNTVKASFRIICR